MNKSKNKEEKRILSKEEYGILKVLDKKWKWIARDKDGLVNVYQKVEKNEEGGFWHHLDSGYLELDHKLFQFIQWPDEEPYSIHELLTTYEEKQMELFNDIFIPHNRPFSMNPHYNPFKINTTKESEKKKIKDINDFKQKVECEIESSVQRLINVLELDTFSRGMLQGQLSVWQDVWKTINQIDEQENLSKKFIEDNYFEVENWYEECFVSDGEKKIDGTPTVKAIAVQVLEDFSIPKEEITEEQAWEVIGRANTMSAEQASNIFAHGKPKKDEDYIVIKKPTIPAFYDEWLKAFENKPNLGKVEELINSINGKDTTGKIGKYIKGNVKNLDYILDRELIEELIIATLTYEYKVDKTPVFHVNDINGETMLCKYKHEIISWTEAIDRGITDLVLLELTEKEIKSYDPRLWGFKKSILEE